MLKVNRFYLRYTRIAAVLFLSKSILLHKDVKALRFFPHVVERHAFCYRSCCYLKKKVIIYGYLQLNSDTLAHEIQTISTERLTLCF